MKSIRQSNPVPATNDQEEPEPVVSEEVEAPELPTPERKPFGQ